ncbi:MAG TPA: tRNA (guanosine(37)-N1)-methyltransferase TrmD, partial [Sphingobacteriaceae bacterium]|nr:tRNA (guanosine(37)-N1)-methyltransferase TrmD [Sphingobacteriaceae bacterium]
YTRPAEWRGHQVPDVLLSGHEAAIKEWQHEAALTKTKERRPDLLDEN